MNGPPPLITEPPPLLPDKSNRKSTRHVISVLLSLCLAVFLADGVVSLVDDSFVLFFGVHSFSLLRGLVSVAGLFVGLGVYGLIGLTPMVPKRLFLPIPIFFLGSMLALFTLAIYWRHHIEQIAFLVSGGEVILGLWLLYWCRRGLKFSWPLVPEERLGPRGFSWRNLSAFVLVNVFVVVPLIAIYLFVSTARAVNHFSDGFMALHPRGFTVQVRKYVRDDGKVIELFPMIHIASAGFYQQVSQTFPSNSVILMEGVSDKGNLLTNKLSYKRTAKSLGLAEQKEMFHPSRGEIVRADVDVGQFSAETINFLNIVTLLHSKGANAENISKLMQYSPSPQFEGQLFNDILTKRNQHLLEEIQSYLPQSDNIMVPWGVAHMPGLAKELQKWGFRLKETREYTVIRFGHR